MSSRRGNAFLGAVAIAVLAAMGYGLSLYLGGAFEPGYEVSARFARAGQLLRDGSDVKLRGVLVGTVSNIQIGRAGKARVRMRLFEDQEIPENVHAAVRAKTLFGEKYIELRLPDDPSADRLRPGDEIPESRTVPPFEVETVLEKGVPILEAVDPVAFGAALHALAEGFTGNEQELRHATVQSLRVLSETERTLPNLERNLVHLRTFASALDDTDTDLLAALEGLTAVGEAIRDRGEEFRAVLAGLVPLSRDLGDILTARKEDLADLAAKGRPVLEAVAERAPKLPGVVSLLDGFLGVWIADLSEGPYWRILVTDPPVPVGEPYGPGEAPSPRRSAIARLAGDPAAAPPDLLELLLEPVPTEDIEAAPPLAHLPGVSARTPR